MTTCQKCGAKFGGEKARCPRCGAPGADAGMFQTSSVLISSSRGRKVYRSVDEVPSRLRGKLLKSTNGANSATILIADRRGRKQIARLLHVQAASASALLRWMTPARKRAILMLLLLLTLTLIGAVFGHRWR